MSDEHQTSQAARGEAKCSGSLTDELDRLRAENKTLRRQLQIAEQAVNPLSLEAAFDGVWELDLRTGILSVSAAWLATLEWPVRTTAVTFEEWMAKIDPATASSAREAHVGIRTGADARSEYAVLLPDGRRRWIRTRSRVLERDNQGNPLRVMGVNIDISRERDAVQRLAAERDLLMGTLRASTAAITVLDENGRIILANDAAERILGVTPDDAQRRNFNSPDWCITDLTGSPIPHDELPFSIIKRTGQPVRDFEHCIVWPNGIRRILSISGAPVLDANDKLSAAVFCVTDATEQREREQERLLRETNLSLSARLAGLYYWTWDLASDELSWADSVYHLFGKARHEMASWKSVFALLEPQDRAALWEALQQGAATDGFPSVEFAITKPDGTRAVIRAMGTTAAGSGGGRRLAGALLDITAQKANEAIMVESLQRLRSISDNLPGGAVYRIVIKPDGKASWRYISSGIESILGVTPEEIIEDHHALYDLIHPDDIKSFYDDEDDAVEKCEPFSATVRVYTRDGALRWLNFRSVPTNLPNGEMACDGIVIDVTEQRRAQLALMESEQRFRIMSDQAPVLIWVRDPSGLVEYFNRRWFEFIGRNEPYTDLDAWENDIHPDDVDRLRRTFFPSARDGVPYQIEYRLRHHRDGWRWVLEIGSPRFSSDGENLGMIGSCVDIHDKRTAELEQARLEEQARHSQKLESLGVLAGGIAHDFNNLLLAIQGNAELVQIDLADSTRAAEPLRDIITTARRASELCRQLLTYAGRNPPTIQTFSMTTLVDEMIQLLRVSVPRSIEIRQDFRDDRAFVQADPAQIRQVVMNLVINAADAIGDRAGRITLRMTKVHLTHEDILLYHSAENTVPGSFVCFSVIDTGCGMSDETRARIFEPFYTTKLKGRGLGLASVLGIAKSHCGAFGVESVEGIGSTFNLYLPRVESAPSVSNSLSSENVASPAPPPTCRGRILLVDDEESVLSVAKRILERLGYTPIPFLRSVEAVAAFEANPGSFRAAVVDMTMPEMDGVAVIGRLRTGRPDFPVLICSGHGVQEVMNRVESDALLGFLPKPYAIDDFQSALKQLLGD